MGSISTIYNGIRTKLAGRALMDVALSDRSTNGVQNKVLTQEINGIKASLSVSEPIIFTYTNVNANIMDATMVKRSGITFIEKLKCKVNAEIPTAHSEVLFTLTSNLPSTAIRCSFITAQGQTYLGKISVNGDVTIDNYTGNAIVINTDLYLSGSIIFD